ncbi:phosphatase PAP2 family protein [Alicyclobacillus dauci]|uniref:Phosphatase PAP2 family protein n=1 Tax=Alicyclobacillus dauci TaxID=1475485 RepID=A0ABY6Z8M7_9BACL|nr:phosphatase PAP2 family protein [Alicyclobacillus dauci]WAH39237.1 phosphatase PAP2 family protein [Alicyclobacillus dauci]
MQRLGSRIVQFLIGLEVYELASLFMLGSLLVVFIVFPARIHRVIGIGNGPPLLANLDSLFLHNTTWLYIGLSICMSICVYATRDKRHIYAKQLHRYARVVMTFIAVLVVFDTINFYITVFNPFDHDGLLRHLDTTLFGSTPATWFDGMTCFPLTLIFCGAYASWFFMTYFSVFVFARHSERAMKEYVTAAVLAFYVGYTTYFFVPAIGPVFTMSFHHTIGPLINLVDGMGPFLSRDCFPSLHTGLSVVMMIYAWRYRRRLLWFYVLDTTLIILSTMYLRVHYGIDLIAGAALAVAVCQIAPAAVARWSQREVSNPWDQRKPSTHAKQDEWSELA